MAADLYTPELSTSDLLACIPGLSNEVLKQWQARGHFVPRDSGPGKGGRRLWPAIDVLQAAMLFEFQRQAVFTVSKLRTLWNLVSVRLVAMDHPPIADRGDWAYLLTIHPENGDLVFRQFGEASDDADADGFERDDAPDLCVVFRVDRFLRRVLSRIEAVMNDKAMPPAPNPTAGAESPEEFLRIYATDSAGRKVRTGLSFIETAELEALASADFRTEEERSRYQVLFGKHERARMQRIANEAQARNAE